MKFGKGLRGAAAMVLSAATLLAMGAIGAGTANADETGVSLTTAPNDKGSITITGGKDHTFELSKLASYSYAATDGGTNLSNVNVQTNTDNLGLLMNIADAVKVANGGSLPSSFVGSDAMGWVARHWLDSSTSPYSGSLRKFVTSLAPGLSYTPQGTSTLGTSDLVISDLPVGIYMLKDTTTTTGVSKSLPILVGTTVGTYTTLANSPLGKVDLKAATPTLTKKATKLNGTTLTDDNRDDELKKAKIGDTVEFTLSSTVPVTTGFDSFTYKMTDTPTVGMVYVSNSQGLTMGSGTGSVSDLTVGAPSNPGDPVTFTFGSFTDQTKFPVGAAIDLTYAVKLTAVSGDNWKLQHNNAKLTYSTDPLTSATTADAAATPTKIAMYSVTLTNAVKAGTALSGGKFKVYAGNDATGTQLKFKANGATFIYDDADGSADAVATDSNGKLVLDGLPAGTYYFQQTDSASGYTKSSFKVTIGANVDGGADSGHAYFDNDADALGLVPAHSLTQDDSNHYNGTITVKNINSIAGLPLTGGLGIALIVLLALISGGVVVVTGKARRKNLVDARQ